MRLLVENSLVMQLGQSSVALCSIVTTVIYSSKHQPIFVFGFMTTNGLLETITWLDRIMFWLCCVIRSLQ